MGGDEARRKGGVPVTKDQALILARTRIRLKAQAPAAEPGLPQGNAASAIAEPLANIGSSMIAGPVSGIAGLLTAGGNAIGATNANPADVVESVGSAMTYEPKTKYGEMGTKIATYPFRKLGEGANYAGEKTAEITGSPALGAAVNAGIQVAPSLLLGGFAKSGGKVTPRTITDTEARITQATDAGYKLTPNQVGNKVGGAVANVAGRPQLERALSMENSKVTNALAQKELGLKDNPNLNRAEIAKAKTKEGAVYGEVSKLGLGAFDDAFRSEVGAVVDRSGSKSFPGDTPPKIRRMQEYYSKLEKYDSADVVAKVRQLREDGFKNQRANRSPEENALGYVQIKIANALDNMMERHAAALGKTDLVNRYKAARVNLAKIHSVESAIRGTDVSAKALSAQAARGVPLSGGLKTIANAYESFDRVLQDVGKIRPSGPIGVMDAVIGVGGALHNPALAGLIAARPLTRGLMESGPYQKAFIKPTTAAERLRNKNALREYSAFSAVPLAQQLNYLENP